MTGCQQGGRDEQIRWGGNADEEAGEIEGTLEEVDALGARTGSEDLKEVVSGEGGRDSEDTKPGNGGTGERHDGERRAAEIIGGVIQTGEPRAYDDGVGSDVDVGAGGGGFTPHPG